VAIVQISRITNRKGLTENLPQLAGAELGWCVDSRQLFIGNGTLEDGAPVIGNTEILTQFSDITVLANYTYDDIVVGYPAQTRPAAGDPVVRTVQAKLDDQASVRDFGAVGDGITDDTVAINWALNNLYCVQLNTQVRRSLFFPAGTYRISETLVIPSYAKLIGEGSQSTIINMDSGVDPYVARYGDSLQQTGVAIGDNGATPPIDIEISAMCFQSSGADRDVFLVESASRCWFDAVSFIGNSTLAQITNYGSVPTADVAGIRFESTNNITCTDIVFDKCNFSNITYGMSTDANVKSATISNSWFNTLYTGVNLAADGSTSPPTGIRVVHNMFDNVYASGVVYGGQVSLNVSAYNIFYNVGNAITSSEPVTPCIVLAGNNNVSVCDLFERSDEDSLIVPRVYCIPDATQTGYTALTMGIYTRGAGNRFNLTNNVSNQTIFTIDSNYVNAFRMMYTIQRGNATRTGIFTVTASPSDGSSNPATYTDDYTETSNLGIILNIYQNVDYISVQYSTTNTGASGVFFYSTENLI
jgi:hypothetical protein